MRGAVVGKQLLWSTILLIVGQLTCKLPASELEAKRVDVPTDAIVDGNSQFAVDLYRQLAKENAGQNLFFSPYSISGAMIMSAEGARDETAAQMGRVLRFPASIKRTAGDVKSVPFETAKLHAAMAKIDRDLTEQDQSPAAKQARARIAELRAKHERIKAEYEGLSRSESVRVAVIYQLEKAEKQLIEQLDKERSKVDQYEIRISNAFWIERDYPFRNEFLKTIHKYHGPGSVFRADFRNRHEAARQAINKHIAQQTKNRIGEMIPTDVLTKLTRLVVTNAVYFRGDWPTPFKEDMTRNEPFKLADGTRITTPIMFKTLEGGRYAAFNVDGSFFKTPRWTYKDQAVEEPRSDTSQTTESKPRAPLYPDADGFAMVEMPYRGDRLSMVVIAPNDPKGLPAIEAKLSAKELKTWIDRLDDRKVRLHLPKFKIATAYTLGDGTRGPAGTLPSMGMPRAFTDGSRFPKGAQFDGIATPVDPLERLYICKILHRATLEVNEQGTEATAATITSFRSGSAALEKVPFDPTFRADRPFLFLIRDKTSGSILFLGRVMKP